MKDKYIVEEPPRYSPEWSSAARGAVGSQSAEPGTQQAPNQAVASSSGGSDSGGRGSDKRGSDGSVRGIDSGSYSEVDSNSAQGPVCDPAEDGNALGVRLEELDIQGENEYVRAIRKFGNPLAHDKQWSVGTADAEVTKIPDLTFALSLKKKFKNSSKVFKSAEYPCFVRDPRANPLFAVSHFEPIRLKSPGSTSFFFGSGLNAKYEGRILSSHDISLADWYQFCEDLTIAYKRDIASLYVTHKTPLISLLPFGPLILSAIGKKMRRGKGSLVNEVLDSWLRNFFNKRAVNVTLKWMKGPLNGSSDAYFPDSGLDFDSDSSSGRSASGSSSRPRRDEHRGARAERRAFKREQRAARRDERSRIRAGRFELILSSPL